MKVPITLIIEQERRRRADRAQREQRIQIELPLPRRIEAPRPGRRSQESVVDIYAPDDHDKDRGVTIINIFGDDLDDLEEDDV